MAAVMKSSMISDSSTSTQGIPEGARRASEGMPWAAAADPEVVASTKRRQFSSSEKRLLLAEADRCKERGELGAFLRRKRIYSSMLSSWRQQLAVAERAALAPQKRGPKPDPAARQIQQLNRENARLQRKLERAELIIDDFGRDAHHCAPPEQNRAGPI